MSVDPSILFSQSINSMNTYLKNKPMAETIGTIMVFFWWLGGWFEDEYLFTISLVISFVVFIQGLFITLARRMPIEAYGGGAFRRLITGLWAQGMYQGGKTPGPAEFDLGFIIPVNTLSAFAVGFYGIFWFSSKYFDRIDLNNIMSINTAYIFIRGVFRGAILAGMYYSVFTSNVLTGTLEIMLIYAYLIEPVAAYIQSTYERSLDPAMINLGMAKLPAAELRNVMISNLFMLIFTMWFKGVQGSMWSLLRIGYLLFAVFAFVYAMGSIRDFNSNPLSKSILNTILGDTQETIENMNLGDRMSYVVDETINLKINKESSLNVLKDSILIPLGEEKGKIKAMVVGKAEALMHEHGELSAKIIEGVTTTLLSKKDFNKLRKEIIPQRFESLDLNNLQLPSLETIEAVINQLGFHLGGWLNKLKEEFSSIKLSNYGVSEMNGVTNVKLPGISVIDGDDMTRVDVMGAIKVTEVGGMTHVRIGSWLNVIDLPKLTFVSVTGITVLDIQGEGTAVDIFGFKISDGVDAKRLDEFKAALLAQMERFDEASQSELGKILLDKNANALMSVNWNGEFIPQLQGARDTYSGMPALGAGKIDDSKLLEGSVTHRSIDPTIAHITGFDLAKVSKKKKKGKKRKLSVDINLTVGNPLTKSKSTKHKLALDEIKGELDSVKEEITAEKPAKKLQDDGYEIIDVNPEDVETLLRCPNCGSTQERGQFCLECGTAVTKE